MNELESTFTYRISNEELERFIKLPSKQLVSFSVIIPTLNQSNFIRETIESVLDQMYPKIEIIVIDGGSADGTLDILEEYREKTKGLLFYESKKDKGQFDAVNKGIRLAKGDVVAWINSDDIYLTNTFWKIASFFYYNRSALVVYGRNKYVDVELGPLFNYPVDWSPMISEQKRKMMHFCIIPQPSLFFKKIVTKMAGGLCSPILDYELWLRWQNDIHFHFYDDFLSMSRLHTDAKTIKDRKDLIVGIMDTVHQYYKTVPYNWTRSLAHHEEYGNRWMSGEPLPVTKKIKRKAIYYWIFYNLLWSPRAIIQGFQHVYNLYKQSLVGRY